MASFKTTYKTKSSKGGPANTGKHTGYVTNANQHQPRPELVSSAGPVYWRRLKLELQSAFPPKGNKSKNMHTTQLVDCGNGKVVGTC